ncbi:hypothetical protein [Streptomyces sp. NBC_00467]|uniref:hypothetical protein n=1 Tax=Streptomyces sp. NBC_00467 TaxID=2975752 RepID=UPI002E191159
METDRGMVVKVLGAGKSPASVTADELAQVEAVAIGADADEILYPARGRGTFVEVAADADDPRTASSGAGSGPVARRESARWKTKTTPWTSPPDGQF